MGRMILNIVTAVSIIVGILSACAVDSPSMVPAFICAGSVAVAAVTCFLRETVC